MKRDSPVSTSAELKGKRVGYAKGTSAHTMVLRYLEKESLQLRDIESVFLPPAEGRIALESGAIDAWSIWDPYMAAAENEGDVRTLVSGQGIVEGREFYLCSRRLAEKESGLLGLFVFELARVKKWAQARIEDVNRFLAEETKLPLGVVQLAEARRNRYDTEESANSATA